MAEREADDEQEETPPVERPPRASRGKAGQTPPAAVERAVNPPHETR